ncbi:hypothetical protein N9K47_00235, partial [bacterium]|nr:hypothetical protein [bacterium]
MTGGSAAPVPRVHCDYTAASAPRRAEQLLSEGLSFSDSEALSSAGVDALLAGRFAFVNVWRSIDPEQPVMQKPLAVCDERTVSEADKFKYGSHPHLFMLNLRAAMPISNQYVSRRRYELIFPDRVGENYSLDARSAEQHDWYYYPRMNVDECLMFKVYDKNAGGPRFVFHTAFDDPQTLDDAPP